MKLLSTIIAILAVCCFLEVPYAKCDTKTSCSAKSFFNGKCEITCDEGTTAKCKSGVFTATCKCVSINDPNPDDLVNPSPTSQQYSDAAAFAQFLHSSSSSALQAMETAVNDAILGASTQDWTLYWSASDSCFQQFDNLTSADKNAINMWRSSHGYTDPL
jgi:hypothetical protein